MDNQFPIRGNNGRSITDSFICRCEGAFLEAISISQEITSPHPSTSFHFAQDDGSQRRKLT